MEYLIILVLYCWHCSISILFFYPVCSCVILCSCFILVVAILSCLFLLSSCLFIFYPVWSSFCLVSSNFFLLVNSCFILFVPVLFSSSCFPVFSLLSCIFVLSFILVCSCFIHHIPVLCCCLFLFCSCFMVLFYSWYILHILVLFFILLFYPSLVLIGTGSSLMGFYRVQMLEVKHNTYF